jgi:hypothetical protein
MWPAQEDREVCLALQAWRQQRTVSTVMLDLAVTMDLLILRLYRHHDSLSRPLKVALGGSRFQIDTLRRRLRGFLTSLRP